MSEYLRSFETKIDDGRQSVTCHRPYHVESLGFAAEHDDRRFVTVEIASERNDMFRGFLDLSSAAELRDKLTEAIVKARAQVAKSGD